MTLRKVILAATSALALVLAGDVSAKTTLKMSIGAPDSQGGEILGMKALKEYVEFKSKGELEIRLFFNTFGGSLQVTEQVKNGTPDERPKNVKIPEFLPALGCIVTVFQRHMTMHA